MNRPTAERPEPRVESGASRPASRLPTLDSQPSTPDMRRFSQRSSLVTLSEINITPLLDLAFVLLIIFVITTPLLEQSLELKLPKGGKPDRPLNERDVHTVEISPKGFYVFDGKPAALAQIEKALIAGARANPNT